MSIPKKIHYCWFGNGEKTLLIQKCIASWETYAPDYEIIEWNETNFDINQYIYSKQAYDIKKYAFVSDVARFHALYEQGGIYLDTDVELLKPLDKFLDNHIFMGYSRDGQVNTGLIMGSEAKQDLLRVILDYYKSHSFLLKNGRANTTTVCTIVSDILVQNGIELDGKTKNNDKLSLYAADYFDPFDFEENKMYKSKNTHTIHYYSATWKSNKDMAVYRIGKVIKRIVGKRLYSHIAKWKHKIWG